MPTPRVLCLWDLTPGRQMLGRLPEVAEVLVREPSQEALDRELPLADAYLASLHVRLDRRRIEAAPNLKVVATPSTGLDHLDCDALHDRGIELISIKTEYELLDRITATAELAWGLLLACVRKIPAASAAAARGHWARDQFRGHQLSGKTLGILGMGRLGRMMAAYGQAFRMNVLGCDLHPRPVPGVDLEFVDLPTLLQRSDILTLHIHLTPENRRLISQPQFDLMRDGAVLINTSRGALIDEHALLAALQSGKVSAAGLDVIEGEWRTDLADHPLIRFAREHDNLVIVPHIGGITCESQRMAHQFVADKLADFLNRPPARME